MTLWNMNLSGYLCEVYIAQQIRILTKEVTVVWISRVREKGELRNDIKFINKTQLSILGGVK
jgi:hypothetical protein